MKATQIAELQAQLAAIQNQIKQLSQETPLDEQKLVVALDSLRRAHGHFAVNEARERVACERLNLFWKSKFRLAEHNATGHDLIDDSRDVTRYVECKSTETVSGSHSLGGNSKWWSFEAKLITNAPDPDNTWLCFTQFDRQDPTKVLAQVVGHVSLFGKRKPTKGITIAGLRKIGFEDVVL